MQTKYSFVEMDDLGEKAYAKKENGFDARADITRNIHGPLPATGDGRFAQS